VAWFDSGVGQVVSVRERAADHVIGTFARADLSGALAATHRAGFGPHARVLDGARGDATRQLARAGLEVISGDPPPTDALLIVVTAPGRTAVVADLFDRLGAQAVLLAARRDEERREPAKPALLAPDVRIGEASGAASES
jgi:hypothetical protein